MQPLLIQQQDFGRCHQVKTSEYIKDTTKQPFVVLSTMEPNPLPLEPRIMHQVSSRLLQRKCPSSALWWTELYATWTLIHILVLEVIVSGQWKFSPRYGLYSKMCDWAMISGCFLISAFNLCILMLRVSVCIYAIRVKF